VTCNVHKVCRIRKISFTIRLGDKGLKIQLWKGSACNKLNKPCPELQKIFLKNYRIVRHDAVRRRKRIGRRLPLPHTSSHKCTRAHTHTNINAHQIVKETELQIWFGSQSSIKSARYYVSKGYSISQHDEPKENRVLICNLAKSFLHRRCYHLPYNRRIYQ